MGPVWPFRSSLACSWMMHRHCSAPQLQGLALLLESPQHPSAGTEVLYPTKQRATCSQGRWDFTEP